MDDPNTLAHAFQSIEGLRPRTQNLTNLIASLTPWERRHIRLQLGASDGLATFEDLPVDLVCLLVPHLHLEDILSCAAVCRHSRATWTDPTTVAAITLHFFPALRPPFTFDAFRAACRKFLRRRAGNFTARLEQPLPHVGSGTFDGEDGWVVRRLDPRLHPDGKYPRGWDETLTVKPAGYGGGNIVWLALPRFFVVDNLYTRERRVVGIPGKFVPYSKVIVGESLVVIFNRFADKLLVYNLETNKSSRFQCPSPVGSTSLRGQRIFLGLFGSNICVLDHDGARLLTTHHFDSLKDNAEEVPRSRLTALSPVIYPHPHLQDRFFVLLSVWLNNNLVHSPHATEPVRYRRQYLIAKEYNGASHVATHEWQSAGETQRNPDLVGVFQNAKQAVALDDQSTYHAGTSIVRSDSTDALALEQPPKKYTTVILQASFNVMTKRFSCRRYNDTQRTLPSYPLPWLQQAFSASMRTPGEWNISWYDAADADCPPPRVKKLDAAGWVVRRELPMGYTSGDYRLYQDGDFIVLLSEEVFYVWSFVEGEERGG